MDDGDVIDDTNDLEDGWYGAIVDDQGLTMEQDFEGNRTHISRWVWPAAEVVGLGLMGGSIKADYLSVRSYPRDFKRVAQGPRETRPFGKDRTGS